MEKSSANPKGTPRPRPIGGLLELQSPSDRITHTGAIEISRSDSPPNLRPYQNIASEVGGNHDREISTAPVCVILSLGLWSSNSGPMGRGPACPWGWCFNFFMKSNKKLFCELLEHLWCFLDGLWSLLVGSGKLLLVF